MFTIHQIKTAQSKVRTGADFPNFIKEINALGVTGYETYVPDGDTVYFGSNGFSIRSGPKYTALTVANTSSKQQFQNDLRAHQLGKTSFPTFCSNCAASGVEKWIVDMNQMTCTYYDKAGNEMLQETISSA